MKYLDEDAKSGIVKRHAATPLKPYEEPLLNAVNPFLPAPSPTATPQLAKEYIYAGSRLLAVEDANANAAAPADLAIWRHSTGYWWVMGSANSQQVGAGWDTSGDEPVPGDYDGDGKTDFSVFRPATSTWWIMKSSDNTFYSLAFGLAGDKVASADYDGNGKADHAIRNGADWVIRKSGSQTFETVAWESGSDKAVPNDYDGDGKVDIAVWRDANGRWFIRQSANNTVRQESWGTSGDIPVPAFYRR